MAKHPTDVAVLLWLVPMVHSLSSGLMVSPDSSMAQIQQKGLVRPDEVDTNLDSASYTLVVIAWPSDMLGWHMELGF